MKRVGGQGVDYSVWNDRTLRYDYYQSSDSPLRAGVIAPTTAIRATSPLGASVGDAARRLPGNARLVGHGPFARGMIAARNSDATALSGIIDGDGGQLLIGLGLAAVTYKLLSVYKVF